MTQPTSPESAAAPQRLAADSDDTVVRPRLDAPARAESAQVALPQAGSAHVASAQAGLAQAGAAAKQIATLPPLDELGPQIRLSEATGQPRRDPQMLVAIGFLYASSAAAAVATALAWWTMIHIETFPTSIRLVQWLKPESWSLTAVLCAVAMAACGAAMVAAPAIAAFHAWNGYTWSRIAAIVATVISALAVLLNTWAYAAIPLALIGAGLLWLPAVGRYFSQWRAFRIEPPKYPRDLRNVQYGPEPRYL